MINRSVLLRNSAMLALTALPFVFKRHAIAAMAAAVAFVTIGSIEPARAEDAAVKFMRKAAASLLRAQKQGTRGAFEASVRRYGHVPAIGLYALGNYRRGLDHGDRKSYYRGLVRFIGRYAAAESPKYPVADVKFASSAIRDGRSVLVDSQVILADGTAYDVRWMLYQNRNSYKVRDAQVLGFWVSPFLQRLFENYIAENGGRVGSLVMALNR
jgi:phospholipid transport system substrate-binding protein